MIFNAMNPPALNPASLLGWINYRVLSSTTNTVIWRSSVVRKSGANPALWLAENSSYGLCLLWVLQLWWGCSANHSAIFVPEHRTTEFAPNGSAMWM